MFRIQFHRLPPLHDGFGLPPKFQKILPKQVVGVGIARFDRHNLPQKFG